MKRQASAGSCPVSGDAGQVLTLPVFRAAAELALVLPMQGEAAAGEQPAQQPLMK